MENSRHHFWRKVLYENTGYLDNYTDKSFLRGLRKNVDKREEVLLEAIKGTFVLIQELCVVVLFILIYVYLFNGWTDVQIVFYYSNLGAVCGFILYRAYCKKEDKFMFGKDLRTIMIFLAFEHLFSPILHTLTDTISTDTIYTLTFFSMLTHLIFLDYGVSAAITSNNVSLSAALFGSVCLASRLSSSYHAFVLLTIAIECFVLVPFVRIKIRKMVLPTVAIIIFILSLLFSISLLLSLLFMCVIILISAVCPLVFVNNQKFKDNIYGPWDEAIVNDAENINELIYS